MVDIIGGADMLRKTIHIVDRSKDILDRDVVGNELARAALDLSLELLLALAGVEDLAQYVKAYALPDAERGTVEVNIRVDIDHAVREHLDLMTVLSGNVNELDAGVVDLCRHLTGDGIAALCQHLAGARSDNGLRQGLVGDTTGKIQLFIIFISADARHIVAPRVKEEVIDVRLSALDGGRLRGAQLAVYFDQTVLNALAAVLFKGRLDALVIAEHLDDIAVGAQS